MNIKELLKYDNIIIQCHDNPDPDTISSGFGIYTYLKSNGKNVDLIYSGNLEITKPNLIEMINELNIPISYVKELHSAPELLITIDCQYGEGNVSTLPCNDLSIIDHHTSNIKNTDLIDIRPTLSSCSTLVWDLLRNTSFDINSDINLSTALYYGLLTDSKNFEDINHPLDKDMIEQLNYDSSLIKQLKNSNLSISDLETAGMTLIRCSHNINHEFAVFRSNPCDPNILGFISDLAIQVNTIDSCIVFNTLPNGYKLSVRSSTKKVKANELVEFLCKNIGSGGGHLDKAGGFISKNLFNEFYPNTTMDTYLESMMKKYHESYDYLYFIGNNKKIELEEFTPYKNKEISCTFVKSTDIFPDGTPMLIRTLYGDINVVSSHDLYLIINFKGQINIIIKNEFLNSYTPINHPCKLNLEYMPHVKNLITGEYRNLNKNFTQCLTFSKDNVYAKELKKSLKLFTELNNEVYTSGEIGDYLVYSSKYPNDLYIIEKDIFNETYDIIE